MIPQMKARSAPANYQQQTYDSSHWIVRWPHQRRFALAEAEIELTCPGVLLDYGTGDAHLLEQLARRGALPANTVAYEPVPDYAAQARATVARCGLEDRVEVVTTIEECFGYTFDCIACLSVLEHMPLPQREAFYDLCERTLSLTGQCVIEVPVELGPAVIVKELVRRILKKREAEYTLTALLRRGVGIGGQDAARYDVTNTATWIHYHTDFDYRVLRDEIAGRFDLTKMYGSPLPRLPAALGSQEVFMVFCRH